MWVFFCQKFVKEIKIQNTRNTPSFTVIGFWGQRGGVAVGVIILAVTIGLNPTARRVRRSRRHTPKTERGGVRYETPNRRWLDGSGPHWCRTRATTGLLMFLLVGAAGNHQSWAETGLCGLFCDLQGTACSQRHGLFPWRKTEGTKREGEEAQTESAPAQGRVYSGRGKEFKTQCNPPFACTKLCAFSWFLNSNPGTSVHLFLHFLSFGDCV
jgi:hypothetical protein